MASRNHIFRDLKHPKKEAQPESLKGYFLISEGNMLDPNFFETVVLILEHNKEGAFGLIVNQPSSLNLHNIDMQLSETQLRDLPIYVGGPVQQEYLFALHSEMPESHQSSHGAIQAVERVIFEPSFAHLKSYFELSYWNSIPFDDRPKIHLFLGYSGWAPGQLEEEIQRDSWLFHPAHPEIVFHEEPEEAWRHALHSKGGIYKLIANSQQDPSLN